MAWIDDRIWCHPKIVGLSDKAKVAYTFGLAYSSGMSTAGKLDRSIQRMLGATSRTRAELVDAGLWVPNGAEGTVTIHDWEEHNGLRDRRREKDRKRKREARARARASAGQGVDK
jgi:hypothetical protein